MGSTYGTKQPAVKPCRMLCSRYITSPTTWAGHYHCPPHTPKNITTPTNKRLDNGQMAKRKLFSSPCAVRWQEANTTAFFFVMPKNEKRTTSCSLLRDIELLHVLLVACRCRMRIDTSLRIYNDATWTAAAPGEPIVCCRPLVGSAPAGDATPHQKEVKLGCLLHPAAAEAQGASRTARFAPRRHSSVNRPIAGRAAGERCRRW